MPVGELFQPSKPGRGQRPVRSAAVASTRSERSRAGAATSIEGRRPARARWLKKLTLLLASTLLTLAALEVAFRVAGYEPIYDVYSEPEAFWQRDSLLGWSLQPGAAGQFVGPRPFPIQFRTPIRINSLGLRGGEIEEMPRGGDRIVLLGDSMAAGFEVKEEDTYASLAEEALRATRAAPVQLINAAVRGYGTDQAYLLYRERLRRLRPDVVVYHTTENDPEDNTTLHRARRPFGKPAFALRTNGSLEMVGHPVPAYPFCSSYRVDGRFDVRRTDTVRSRLFCWIQTRLADRSALFSFVTTRLAQNATLVRTIYDLGTPQDQARTATGDRVRPDYKHRVTSALIRRLASLAGRDGARFVLLGQQADIEPLDLAREGIEIVRTDEAVGPNPGDEVRFPVDGHYNERGHRLVGELLGRRLAKLLQA